MTKKEFIEALSSSDYPDNAHVELSRLIAVDLKDENSEAYDVLLDFPIIGLAYNPECNDLRLVLECPTDMKWLKKFGEVMPFGPEVTDVKKEEPTTH
jgi:hypothetical protein